MKCCAFLVLALAILIGVPLHFTYNRSKVTSVKGQCAVVTGASMGIGVTIAEHLAAEGVTQLVLAARSVSKLEKVAEDLRKKYAGTTVLVVAADVSKDADRKQLKAKVTKAFGSCGILVNNAGVERWGSFEKVSAETIDFQLDVNLKGLIHLTHEFLPDMLAAKKGHVVNIASFAGKMWGPFSQVYVASKFGVVGFTHAMRSEMMLRETGVTFHVICPAFITDVGMAADAISKADPVNYEHVIGLFGSSTPMDSAKATVDAIEYDHPEIMLNSPPLRPLVILAAMFPRITEWLPMDEQTKAFYMNVGNRMH
eukprot:gnl/MRDRNA2_/MRDRNA2_127026_c0_seq1.p1 gnl/MRDRNA2_/MRDRNA2_127026_c0~~gnl/MRDRNA2_/MRDRNA2_127026_c0_seq1.p1  ORF type:complete len:311 (+),score=61.05 gnl/MRDRNA2_/MRDRNA2_127026_c0_seq1:79-1011(+)